MTEVAQQHKGFISKIYKQFIQLNIKQTNKQPNPKLSRRSKQIFLQRRQTDDQQSPEKMFDVSTYERNANQNHKNVSPHTGQNDHHQSTNNKGLRGYGEKRTLLHCWKEHKLVLPLWRIAWRFHQELKIELSHEPAIPILGIYPERMKTNSK